MDDYPPHQGPPVDLLLQLEHWIGCDAIYRTSKRVPFPELTVSALGHLWDTVMCAILSRIQIKDPSYSLSRTFPPTREQ